MRNKLLKRTLLALAYGANGPSVVKCFLREGISSRRAKKAVRGAESILKQAKVTKYA